MLLPVAGPGYPRRGRERQFERVYANLLFDKLFCRKLHENERNWSERGRTFLGPPGYANDYPITCLGL